MKRSLPRFGTNKQLYESYFAEYCVRKKYIDGASDKFLEFLRLINLVYHPPAATESSSDSTSGIEHLPSAESRSETAAIAGATDNLEQLENWDIGFSLDD